MKNKLYQFLNAQNFTPGELQDILVQCEQWEAQSLQTEKRISN